MVIISLIFVVKEGAFFLRHFPLAVKGVNLETLNAYWNGHGILRQFTELGCNSAPGRICMVTYPSGRLAVL